MLFPTPSSWSPRRLENAAVELYSFEDDSDAAVRRASEVLKPVVG